MLSRASVTVRFVVIITSSVLGVQGALEIVHLKVFAPTPNPVSPEVGEEGVVIVPEPAINVQVPVPTAGVFPANVAVVTPQAGVWSVPAAATVGGAFTVTDAVFTAGAAPQALLAVKV